MIENGLQEMLSEYVGKFFNGACSDPCDMLVGPCACGASHHWRDWPEEMQRKGKAVMYKRYMIKRRESI